MANETAQPEQISVPFRAASSTRIFPANYRLEHLVNLYLRPDVFFRRILENPPKMGIFMASFVCAMAILCERFELRLLGWGPPALVWEESAWTMLTSSWVAYWFFIAGASFVLAFCIWLGFGWWYKLRLRFAGAAHVSLAKSQTIAVWSHFTWALPTVGWALLQTVIFPDFKTAFAADTPLFLSVMPFWAVFVGHRAAISVFEVNRIPAFVWFALLPFVAIAFGNAIVWLS